MADADRLIKLENAVQAAREKLKSKTDCLIERASQLRELADALVIQFEEDHVTMDTLDEVIHLSNQAVELNPLLEHDAAHMSFLAVANHERYRWSSLGEEPGVQYLNKSIELQRHAIKVSTDRHMKSSNLKGLSDLLYGRYRRTCMAVELENDCRRLEDYDDVSLSTKELSEDLEEAIVVSKEAISLLDNDSPDKPTYILHEGFLFFLRFRLTGTVKDLEEAIVCTRQVYNAVIGVDKEVFAQLSMFLVTRYNQFGRSSDIEEAIKLAREILAISNYDEWHHSVTRLSRALFQLYKKSKEFEHLEEAFSYATQSFGNARGRMQTIIGGNLWHELYLERYKVTKDLSDLDDLIEFERTRSSNILIPLFEDILKDWWVETVGQRPHKSDLKRALTMPFCISIDGSSQISCLRDVADALELRYQRKGKAEDIADAVDTRRRITKLLMRPLYLLELGRCLLMLYEEAKDPEAAYEATQISQQLSPNLASPDSEYQYQYLRFKSVELAVRSRVLGNFESLEEAIKTGKQVLEICSNKPNGRSMAFFELGSMAYQMFCTTKLQSDIECALKYCEQAMEVMSENFINKAHCLSNYSSYLLEYYRSTKRLQQLDETIRLGSIAVKASSDGSYQREIILDNLATALYQRFLVTDVRNDLEGAISLSRQAVQIKLEDPIGGCTYFLNLAAMLCEIHTFTEGQESVDYLTQAVELVTLARTSAEQREQQHPNLSNVVCFCSAPSRAIYVPPKYFSFIRGRIERYRSKMKTSDYMSYTDQALCMGSLILLFSCYHECSDDADINEPIRFVQDAVDRRQNIENRETMAWLTCALSVGLVFRFHMAKSAEDLIHAIALSKRALDMSSEDDIYRPFYMIVYSCGLYARYSYTARLPDLYECIRISFQAWNMSSVGNEVEDFHNQSIAAGNLSYYLTDRYLREGDTQDFEKSIEMRQAEHRVPIALDDDDFTDFHRWRKKVTQKYSTCSASVTTPMHLMLQSVADSPKRLYDVSTICLQVYDEIHSPQSLSQAIFLCRCSVKSTPQRHSDSLVRTELLGRCLALRYDLNKGKNTVIGEENASTFHLIDDLNGALDSLQLIIDAEFQESPLWSSALHLLGPLYMDRYRISGDIGDLRMGVILLDESLKATPNDHDLRCIRLQQLGAARMDIFGMFNRASDLELAKQHFWDASESSGSPSLKADSLTDLATAYQADHNMRTTRHLYKSIELYDMAQKVLDGLKSQPQFPEYSAKVFSGRGFSYFELYKATKIPQHLEDSVENMKQALTSGKNRRFQVLQLVKIAEAKIEGYVATQDKVQLADASQYLQNAVDITRSFCSKKASDNIGQLHALGACYRSKYEATKSMSDLDLAICLLDEAFELSPLDTARDLTRLISISKDLTSALKVGRRWDRAYVVASRAVPYIVTTTPRFLDISDSQLLLSKYSSLASDGAAFALSAGREPMEAVEILEAGRGVSMLALNELRSDSTSQNRLPDEDREKLHILQKELEDSSPEASRDTVNSTQNVGESLRRAARRVRAGRNLTKLILSQHRRNHQMVFTEKIKSTHLAQASVGGAVIVVNVSYRCDALLIKGAVVQALPLPKLSIQKIQDWIEEANFTSPQVLEWLWETIVSPVLQALGHTGPPRLGQPWPRIWWIPTGPLSKFPLHAAGRHREECSFDSTIDRVISSYSVSIRGLVESVNWGIRSARNKPNKDSESKKALVIAMDYTPGINLPLRHACEEAEAVARACELMSMETIRQDRCTKNKALLHLRDSEIFHFAGHGYRDNIDPSKSHLRLQDWQSDPLTVANLIEMNLRERKPFLAYLGACGTGEIRNEKHLDESIHLISACQLAGFRHVIGTLCKVDDRTCVDIASITYDILCKKGLTDASVSEGLHHAVRKLREDWRIAQQGPTWAMVIRDSQRDNERTQPEFFDSDDGLTRDASPYNSDEDDYEAVPLQWAPYVHYGC
ncbi:tpr domain containing [Fusarium longipes]|uniref:Tpr domain containing n=1 Tax=Fusarium longipes TaxID=694270 RepID=A0A395SIC1_9HYPO|nr:tpr domain containing [Fusarium longipes]